MARRRPDRSRPAGTRPGSSIPVHDGAVLPILHLNGYKISNPTVLVAHPASRAARRCSRGTAIGRCSWRVTTRRDAPAHGGGHGRGARRHRHHPAAGADRQRGRATQVADDRSSALPRAGPAPRRSTGCRRRGASGPTRCRSTTCAAGPDHMAVLESWLRELSARIELFDAQGRPMPSIAALAPSVTDA